MIIRQRSKLKRLLSATVNCLVNFLRVRLRKDDQKVYVNDVRSKAHEVVHHLQNVQYIN